VIKKISEVGKYSSDSNILLKMFEKNIGQFRLKQVINGFLKLKPKGLKVSIFSTYYSF
jgi:hypothetical protein